VVNTVVFLWISAAPATTISHVGDARADAGPPSREALSTLADFGRARGLTFVSAAPSDARADRPLGSSADDALIVDAIESELEQARTALSALEEASASARLTRVESQLLSHPHLPQATFLMGECLALKSQAAREQSPALATALEARRAALEGPRALAFGAPSSPPAEPASSALDVSGLLPTDELELDGSALGVERRVSLPPGLHHARVWRRGRLAFASFVELAPDQSTLALDVPRLTPCSREDFADTSADVTPRGIACARWAKVREEPAGVGVALCEHERCSAFVHWQRRPAAPFAPIPVERERGLPTWATFTIAGTAALLATGLVLWQTGAFDHGRPNAASWEYGGLNPRGLRF